jgi:hypothetical protein
MAKKRRDGDDDDSDLTPLARVMRSEKRPHVIVMFPKLNVPVAIVNPSDEEVAESAAAATQFLKQELRLDEFQLSLMLDRNLYENEEARQLLSRVLRDPADIDASFATVDELREHLTADVRKILMRHLAGFIATQDPEPKEKDGRDDAAFRGFIEDLKESGDLFEYLTSCDTDMLLRIAISLAEALPKRPSPSSTDTSSSNSPSSSTSDRG